MTARDELPEPTSVQQLREAGECRTPSQDAILQHIDKLRARCEELEKERDEALSDPMNAGWEHAKAARADRESALSQWKKERQLREQAEAKLAEREKDAGRCKYLISLATEHDNGWTFNFHVLGAPSLETIEEAIDSARDAK